MDLLDDDLDLNLNSSFSDMLFPMSFTAPPVPPPAMEVPNSAEDSASWSPMYEPTTSVEDSTSSSEKPQQSSRKQKVTDEDDDDFHLDDEDDEEEGFVQVKTEDTKPRRGNTKGKKASTRKRGLDESVDSVVLSRDNLLTISSDDFEALVESVQQRRPLTEAEKKDVRRQKRLIKNRESAAQSRNRKKQALETLASENEELRGEVEEQKSRFAALESILAGMGHLEAVVKQLGAPLGASRNAGRKAGVGIMFIMILSFSLFNLPLLMSSSSPLVSGPVDNFNLRQLMAVETDSLDHQLSFSDFNHQADNCLSASNMSGFDPSSAMECEV